MERFEAQLALGLMLKDEATFENFYPGKNTEVIAALKHTASGLGECIYLCGPKGNGISHLLQATCHFASKKKRSAAYLPLESLIKFPPHVLQGFENTNLICIDDLQMLSGNLEWEEAIFHLYNRVYALQNKMVISANKVPQVLKLSMPDLVSRLSWGGVYQLTKLSDEEKLTALTERAKDRGVSISQEVAKFILNHYPRDLSALFKALDRLDKASLAAKRRITIPFTKDVLSI